MPSELGRGKKAGMVVPKESVKWLGRNVVAIGLVSLLTDASSEMVLPLLPVFLTTTLGGGAVALGVVEGVANLVASVMKLASGVMADRTKKRQPLVLAGYGISSIARPLVAFALAPVHVVLIRAADRVGKGLRSSPRDALLADSVPPEARGRAFGFHRAMDHAGAVVGPLLAVGLIALLGESEGALRQIFLLAAIPGALAVLAVVFGVRDVETKAPAAAEAVAPSPNESAAAKPRGASALVRFLLPLGLFTLGNASDTFLLLKASDEGASLSTLPILWVLLHLVKVAGSLYSGRIADRVGARRVIAFGWVLYAVIYAAFAFVDDPWLVAALFVVYGTYHGLTEGPERALISQIVPKARRGTGFGLYHLTIGVLGLVASVLFGVLWDQVSPAAAFLTGAGLALLAALALRFSDSGSRSVEETGPS